MSYHHGLGNTDCQPRSDVRRMQNEADDIERVQIPMGRLTHGDLSQKIMLIS